MLGGGARGLGAWGGAACDDGGQHASCMHVLGKGRAGAAGGMGGTGGPLDGEACMHARGGTHMQGGPVYGVGRVGRGHAGSTIGSGCMRNRTRADSGGDRKAALAVWNEKVLPFIQTILK